MPIAGTPACTITPPCAGAPRCPGTPACAGAIACSSAPPCPGCNCLGVAELTRMGAGGVPAALPPWRCGSATAGAPGTGSVLVGTEGVATGVEAAAALSALPGAGIATFGPAGTSMICDAMVLGLACTTVVAVGGLSEADFASLGCPGSDSSGERARLLVSPSGVGRVATGYIMTAERRTLSGAFAESAPGKTGLTGTAPVERPAGTAPPELATTHAFTRSEADGAESIGLTSTALFVGLASEDILRVSEGADAALVGLSGLSPCGNGRARAGEAAHGHRSRWRSVAYLCECMRAYVLVSGHERLRPMHWGIAP